MRNSKRDGVSVDRSVRRLSRVESQTELTKNLLHRWVSIIPLGPKHHHDRVSQKSVSVQSLQIPFSPNCGW